MNWKEFFRPTKTKILLFFLIPVYAQISGGGCGGEPIMCDQITTSFILPLFLTVLLSIASPQPSTVLTTLSGSVLSYMISCLIVFLYPKFVTTPWRKALTLKEISRPTWQKWLLSGVILYLFLYVIEWPREGVHFNKILLVLPVLILAYFTISSLKIKRLWLKLGGLGWSLSNLLIWAPGLFHIDAAGEFIRILLQPSMIFLYFFSPIYGLFFRGAGDLDVVVFISMMLFAPYFYFLAGALAGYIIEAAKRKKRSQTS